VTLVIDRRLNDRGKSAVNRQRFLRRYKESLRKSLADAVAKRSITDMERGGDVRVPAKDISEPAFRHGRGGDREWVHPGNRTFSPGDRIPRPPRSGEGERGGEPGEGDATDDFVFALSREEFMALFFDDLELPRLARTLLGEVRDWKPRRAGYTPSGAPANLSVIRTLRTALARRIALKGALKQRLRACSSDERPRLERRIRSLPFLDEIDLRYRHRVLEPQPARRAVMFCLMDVSASMTEEKKDLAKRFFTLLYLFLTRKYEKVELVFIRHTEDADEVDEDAFFHDPKSGGTVVLSALKLMREVIDARYPPAAWNIYGAQVSDGDAFGADSEKSRALLEESILPLARYFAYVEVPDDDARQSPLGFAYGRIAPGRFAMKRVLSRRDVYPVLRELFRKDSQ
jgi:uncharacterized sporulation protein YeaH/YhbH (DUF444 family)